LLFISNIVVMLSSRDSLNEWFPMVLMWDSILCLSHECSTFLWMILEMLTNISQKLHTKI